MANLKNRLFKNKAENFLIAVCAIQVHCRVLDNPNSDIRQSEPSLLSKIKNKAGEIVENVYHHGEEAVETIKHGYQETKCRLHQIASKVKAHEHEHDPCFEHKDYEEHNVDVHINHTGENHAGYQNGQQIGKKLDVPNANPQVQTGQGKIDIRAGATPE
ncbi:unnamed protein product [Phyllotreta striolata]|uniref:Uncharacterized protein n=1 Tax=Phyllotreta striolata TaxID=444603 RepID=A0A9P0DP42_PHYSR|nr:unnamed protein product [Phyllotreta striolata]